MARNVVLILVAVAVVVAAVWFLGGSAGLFHGDGGREVGGPGDGGGRPVAGPEDAGVGDPATEHGGAALAARRPERRGTGSIAARILDVKQAALAGATVRVLGTGYGGEVVALEAASDAEGAALFPAVPAGVGYVLRVEASGQPVVNVPDVEVRAGRRTDLGAVLVGARAVLAGQVVDENGAAVAGADVRAFSTHENLMEMLGNMMEMFTSLGREPTPLAKATTDADGRFRLADLGAGALLVRATTARKRAAFAKVRMTADGPAGGPPTLRLEPGVLVAGTVVEASGAPVSGATVAIMSQNDGTGGGGLDDSFDFFTRRVFAATDAKGAFSALVAEGVKDFRGVVEAAGFPTTVSREFASGDTNVRIVLARGAVLEITTLDGVTGKPVPGAQVVAMVGEGAGFGSKESGGSILNGVTDERGVVALPSQPGKIEMLMVTHPTYASSMVSPAQQEAMRAVGSPLGGAGDDVPRAVKAGETAHGTVRLKAGVRLTGRVADAAGAPLAGVEVKPVSFLGSGSGTTAHSDAEGNYEVTGLTALMGQAPAMVSFRAPGYVGASETVMLTEDVLRAGEVRRDVTLRRAATLSGRVLDEEGRPVAGARVRHTGGSGGFDVAAMFGAGAGVVTGSDGAYVLTEVPPSSAGVATEGKEGESAAPDPAARFTDMMRLRVAATADGFVPGRSEPLRVREGEQVEVPPIRLSRGIVAHGVVRLPGGRPAGGARVEARLEPDAGPSDMAEMIQSMQTLRAARNLRADAEGRFEIPGLARGKLTVVARVDGFAPSRRQAKVGTDPVEVDVTVRPAADVAGRVAGSDGRPLAQATVSVEGGLVGVEGDDGYVDAAVARTDADGRFRLTALPSGTLTLAVRADGHKKALVTAAAGGAPLDVRLEARLGQRPRDVVQKEINEVSLKFASAKDDDERKALQARLVELMQELGEDAGSDSAAPAPPDVAVPDR